MQKFTHLSRHYHKTMHALVCVCIVLSSVLAVAPRAVQAAPAITNPEHIGPKIENSKPDVVRRIQPEPINMSANAPIPGANSGQIKGTVFQDYNSNGVMDTTGSTANPAIDMGVAGIAVQVYDATGAQVGATATTVANGSYTINGVTDGTTYRVEFSNLPTGYESSFHGSGTGTTSGTSVQFVTGGTGNVSFGINRPCDYCQQDPELATSQYYKGNKPTQTKATIVGFPYNAGSSTAVGYDNPTTPLFSTALNKVGTTWGLGYARSRQQVYAAAYFKRHAQFGPGADGVQDNTDDPGAIYVIDRNTGNVVSTFSVAGVTTNAHDIANYDSDNGNTGWDAVGKTALGGLDLSDDDQTLYVMDVQNRRLVALDAVTGAQIAAVNVPTTGVPTQTTCASSDVRPFAVEYYHGVLYFGLVCSAESTGNVNDLWAYVYTADPVTLAIRAAPVFSAPLNYPRGQGNDGAGQVADWNPWTPTYQTVTSRNDYPVDPQPMLTGLTFDNDRMVLGLRDRFSDQVGNGNLSQEGTTNRPNGVQAGDILQVCQNNTGQWTLESNGLCNGRGTSGNPNNSAGQGPGNGEFYYEDDFSTPHNSAKYHDEVSSAGVVQVPGFPSVAVTVFDPIPRQILDNTYDGGVRWLNNSTGALDKSYSIYDGSAGSATNQFGKSGGMGDLVALCDPAPLEIGNRVWNDTNGNGIQDAGEAGINNVTVQLQTPTGISTTVTSSDGNYYFSDLNPNTPYTITINPTQGGLSGLTLTQANTAARNGTSATSNNAISDTIDSDAVLVNSLATIDYTTGNAGQNNHGLDFGFHAPFAQFGDRAWIESDQDGLANTGIVKPIAGLTITATSSSGQVYTTTTNANGYYSFTVLATTYTIAYGTVPASYGIVTPSATPGGNSEIGNAGLYAETSNPDQSHSNGTTVTVAAGEANWHVDFAFHAPIVQIGNRLWIESDTDGDATTGSVTPVVGQIVTATSSTGQVYTATTNNTGLYTITVPANDTYTVTTGTPVGTTPSTVITSVANNANAATNNNKNHLNTGTTVTVVTTDNLSVDFGFHAPLAQFGDRVWIESDTDGKANTGTITPVAGMLITATAGANVYTTTTNAAGYYSFTTPAGTYNVTYGSVPASYGTVTQSSTPGGNTENGNAGVYAETGNPDQSHTNGVTVTVAAGQANWHVDFAFTPMLVKIGNRLWVESDSDGNATTGTVLPVIGQIVTATSSSGAIYTATTDANGLYTITVPANNVYTVTTATPLGTVPSVYNGTPGNNQSHNPSGTPVTIATTDNLSVDFGFHAPLAQFGDRVWIESDTDGLANTGTITPVAGMTITATDGTHAYTTTTNAQGYYNFTVPVGVYTVTYGNVPSTYGAIAPSATPGGNTESGNAGVYAEGSKPDQSHGNNTTVTVMDGQANWHVDFAFHPVLGSIGDTVWGDLDQSGGDQTTQGSEPGLSGVVVTLTQPNGVQITTTTSITGFYLFPNLPLGVYTVTVSTTTLPAGYQPTPTFDANGGNDSKSIVTLTPAVPDRRDQDFSYPPVLYDRGDLPDGNATNSPNYATLSANNGPSHVIVPGLHIGAIEDNELDGQPDPMALGDDKNPTGQPDDEDGVTLPAQFISGQTALITVTVVNTTGQNATLYSFIDWNGDGDFNDLNEQLTVPANNSGSVVLTVNVPATATTTSQLGARFRLSTDANLKASGPASNGEVEDYLLQATPILSLGNRVWRDDGAGGGLLNDGKQNGNEVGVANVVVNLLDANGNPAKDINGNLTAAQTTDANGYYLFTNLAPGDYMVEIAASNFTGAGPLVSLISSTGNSTTGVAPDEDITPGDQDDNGNDVKVNGGIRSNPVTLSYGQEPTGDSDLGPAVSGNALNNNSNLQLDFGFIPTVNLGNLVWVDKDNNGKQDAGEIGIDGVKIELFRAGDNPLTAPPVQTATTSGGGFYNFTGLIPGQYFVYIPMPPASYPVSSTPTNTADNGQDNDDNGSQPGGSSTPVTSPVINLTPGQEPASAIDGDGTNGDLTVDFGFFAPVTVGDTVWYDNNGNGLQDASEPGVQGVKVTLLNNATGQPVTTDANGNPLTPQTTDANGKYLFTNLPPGNYAVQFDLRTLPNGYKPTTQDASGVPDDQDSDANPSDGKTASTGFLPSGSANLTLDMGIHQPATVRVGDYVWVDQNGNGLQDVGEPGVQGVKVTLFDNATGQPVTQDAFGNPITAQTTDANGKYLFTNLPGGSYYVQFDLTTLPAGYVITKANTGDDAADSDADATGKTAPTPVLKDGEQDLTLDLGIYQPASIGDYVWLDKDVDGVQDAGEPAVQGVQVALFKADGSPATDVNGNPVTPQMTDVNGKYQFTNLPPDAYYVQFTPPANYFISTQDQGTNDRVDNDVNPTTGKTAITTLISGENDLTWDLGLYQGAAIGNYVWHDKNGNGLQEAGEPGLPAVTVTLYDSTGKVLATTETDANGYYGFSNLTPGDYSVQFATPNGYVPTPPNQGNEEELGSDAVNGRTVVTTLTNGEHDTTWDAGFTLPATIGSYAWDDGPKGTADGIKTPGEPSVPGMIVILLDANGQEVAHTTTDNTGFFQFTNLAPGDYSLKFITPNGAEFTKQLPGVNNNSDVNPATGETVVTTLKPGQIDFSWGAGIVNVPTALDTTLEPGAGNIHLYLPVVQNQTDAAQGRSGFKKPSITPQPQTLDQIVEEYWNNLLLWVGNLTNTR